MFIEELPPSVHADSHSGGSAQYSSNTTVAHANCRCSAEEHARPLLMATSTWRRRPVPQLSLGWSAGAGGADPGSRAQSRGAAGHASPALRPPAATPPRRCRARRPAPAASGRRRAGRFLRLRVHGRMPAQEAAARQRLSGLPMVIGGCIGNTPMACSSLPVWLPDGCQLLREDTRLLAHAGAATAPG
jgi:hypothetical protein